MKWILVNATKSRRQAPADAAPPTPAAAPAPAPRPPATPAAPQVAASPAPAAPRAAAPAPADGGIRTTVSPLPVPAPAGGPSAGPAAAPAAVVAAAPVAPVVAQQPAAAPPPTAAPAAAPAPASPANVPTAGGAPRPGAAPTASVDDDDEEDLIPIKQVEPQPSAAVMRNYPKGTVKVRFEVLPNGNTSNIQVLSSTQRQLNSSVVNAVREWTFKPVKKTQTVEVEFAMNFE